CGCDDDSGPTRTPRYGFAVLTYSGCCELNAIMLTGTTGPISTTFQRPHLPSAIAAIPARLTSPKLGVPHILRYT
ncbi:MAG: hypothetical protein KDI62_18335, partial [Anaerolineae bacterium]|nr:hypothetical protein [Anaerolineae bacterium]